MHDPLSDPFNRAPARVQRSLDWTFMVASMLTIGAVLFKAAVVCTIAYGIYRFGLTHEWWAGQ